MRYTGLALTIRILCAMVFLTMAVETRASAFDALAVAPMEPIAYHILAVPGMPVTLSCSLYNLTTKPLTVTPALKLPSGWRVLSPLAPLTVKAGQSQILVVPIQIATDAREGLYRIRLFFTGSGLAEPVETEFLIEVIGGKLSALRVEASALRREVVPRETVTLVCKLYNTGEKPLEITPQLELPPGWQVLIPPAALALGVGEDQTLLLPILVPEDARAGEATISLKLAGEELDGPVTVDFPLQVLAVKGLDLQLQKAPSYVVAEPFQATFIAWNKGNTALNVAFSAKETNGFKLTVTPASTRLEAGEMALIQVAVQAPANLKKQVTEIVQLTAIGDDQTTRAAASAKVEVIPRSNPSEDAFWKLPLKLEVGGVFNGESPFFWRITGSGTLAEDDPGSLRLELSDTTHFISYVRPDFGFALGEQGFRLSPLTEWEETADGLMVQGLNGVWSWLLIYHEGEQDRAGVSLGYLPRPDTGLSLNYLAQPELPGDLWSIRGRFAPLPAVGLDLEYGCQADAEAVRLAGNYKHGPLTVSTAWRQEQPGYLGEEYGRTYLDLEGTFHWKGPYSFRFDLDDRREFSLAGDEVDRRRLASLELQGRWGSRQWFVQYTEKDSVDSNASLDFHGRSLSFSLHVGAQGYRLYQRFNFTGARFDLTAPESFLASYYLSYWRLLPQGSFTAYLDTDLPLTGSAPERFSLGLGWAWQWGPYYFRSDLALKDPAAGEYQMAATIRRNWPAGQALMLQIGGRWSSTSEPQYNAQLHYITPFSLRLGRRSGIGGLSGHVLDGDGKGAPGVILQLNSLTTVTNADGWFEFPAVSPGTYYLTARADSLPSDRVTAPALPWRLELGPGEERTQDFILYKEAAVRGRIKIASADQPASDQGAIAGDGYDQPKPDLVMGVALELVCGDERYQCRPDENGEFVFEHLCPGEWRLIVHRNGLSELYDIRPSELDLELGEGQEMRIEVEIVPVLREVQIVEGGEVQSSVTP